MSPEATTAIKFLAEALLHNLWQGAVIAGLLLLVLRWVPARSAQLRYWASVVALLLLVFSVPVTVGVLSVVDQKADYAAPVASASTQVGFTVAADDSPGFQRGIDLETTVAPVSSASAERQSLVWQEWLLLVWLLGAVVGLIRVFRAACGVRRLRIEAKPLIGLVGDDLAGRCGLRKAIPIRESARVATACICGFFRPVILLPLSLATQLTPEQLEVVIAHEFAHLKRLDPLWNLCQLIAEALLFFNPFLWWISESIRNEREACCDEFVIRAMGRKREYLQALLRSSETAVEGVLTGALAFSGNNKGGGPLARVRRILKPDAVPEVRVRFSFIVGLLVAALAFFWVLQAGSVSMARALTAEERIDRIETVREAYPQYALESAESASNAEFEADLRIAGQLLRPDGGQLERAVKMIAFADTGRRTIHSSQRTDREGNFSFNVKAGVVALLFDPEDYAPLRVELGSIDADQENLQYTLDVGYSAEVRLVDASTGQPLSGAEVEMRAAGSPQGYPVSLQSDEEGEVVLEHLSGDTIQLTALQAGYGEGLWKEMRLAEGEERELRLESVEPLVVRVTDVTGRPLEGAQLQIAARKGTDMNMSYGGSLAAVATAGSDGLLEAGSLRSDCLYYYVVSREGYIGRAIGPLTQGQSLELALESRRSVQVELSGFDQNTSAGEVRISQALEAKDTSYWLFSETVDFTVEEGKASFTYEPSLDLTLGLEVDEFEFSFTPEEWKQGVASVRLPNYVMTTDNASAETATNPAIGLREVVIRIQTAEGDASANGTVLVNYLKNGDREGVRRVGVTKSVLIKDGVGKLTLPIPNKIGVTPEGIAGYWFEPRNSIEVNATQAGTSEILIEAVDAGGIYGRVFDRDGSPADGVLVGVFEKLSEEERSRGSRNLGVRVKNSAFQGDRRERYLASPLPLEGTYIVSLSREFTYVFSKPVVLTPQDPVRELDLQLPQGVRLSGRVLRPDGSPVPLHEIQFLIDADGGNSFSRGGLMTGADGNFTIEGVNPKVRGVTYLIVKDVKGCQPLRYQVDFSADEQEMRLEAGRRISGQVIDQKTGRLVIGAEIYAMREPYVAGAWPTWFDTADTDEDGRFEFANLPKGSFAIGSRSGKSVGRQPVVKSGDGDPVVVKIETYEWFDGSLGELGVDGITEKAEQMQGRVSRDSNFGLKEIDFVTGPQLFRDGDRIEINSVKASSSKLWVGDKITVSGTY